MNSTRRIAGRRSTSREPPGGSNPPPTQPAVDVRRRATATDRARASRSCAAPASPRARGGPPTARSLRPRRPGGRPRRRAPNSSCSGSAIISCGRAKQCTSQKPTTAWLRAHQRAVGDLVGLARGQAVGDEAAERRQRAQRLVEHAPARHLEHDVDLGAAVGLAQRGVEVLRVGVDRGVGAELERQRALLLGRGGRDHAAGAVALGELDRERADAARGGVDDDALALGQVRGGLQQVPGAQALDDDAPAPRRRRRRRGAGTRTAPAPPRTPRSRRCRSARPRAARRPRPPPRRRGSAAARSTRGRSSRGRGCRRS